MIDCTTMTLHERFVIANTMNGVMDDAGSAFFTLEGLENLLTEDEHFSKNPDPFMVIGILHTAKEAIRNAILSYVAITQESVCGTDFFAKDLAALQQSMDAARIMKSLGELAMYCKDRAGVSHLPPEEALDRMIKGVSA